MYAHSYASTSEARVARMQTLPGDLLWVQLLGVPFAFRYTSRISSASNSRDRRSSTSNTHAFR